MKNCFLFFHADLIKPFVIQSFCKYFYSYGIFSQLYFHYDKQFYFFYMISIRIGLHFDFISSFA